MPSGGGAGHPPTWQARSVLHGPWLSSAGNVVVVVRTGLLLTDCCPAHAGQTKGRNGTPPTETPAEAVAVSTSVLLPSFLPPIVLLPSPPTPSWWSGSSRRRVLVDGVAHDWILLEEEQDGRNNDQFHFHTTRSGRLRAGDGRPGRTCTGKREGLLDGPKTFERPRVTDGFLERQRRGRAGTTMTTPERTTAVTAKRIWRGVRTALVHYGSSDPSSTAPFLAWILPHLGRHCARPLCTHWTLPMVHSQQQRGSMTLCQTHSENTTPATREQYRRMWSNHCVEYVQRMRQQQHSSLLLQQEQRPRVMHAALVVEGTRSSQKILNSNHDIPNSILF
jgi:hypothetical protein